jgi:hypothetical protein
MRRFTRESGARVLNVISVQTGNYLGRGAEYVRNLQRMVCENLTMPHRFVCLTDAQVDGIECIPAKFENWWEKVRMFERGLFEGRCLYLDLDTLILGNIDHIAAYAGSFATLHDFWRGRKGLGPAVIVWTPGDLSESLYDEWKAEGFPRAGTDQTWIENRTQGRFQKQIDLLQDLFPGQFVSYKEHCTAARRGWRNLSDQVPPPDGARVVCFHGRPRPHEVGGWVHEVWGMEVAHG